MADSSLSSSSAAAAAAGAETGGGASGEAAEFGFDRAEFGKAALAGTVGLFDRHLFLSWKTPAEWPHNVEAVSDDDPDTLPRLLADAIKRRRSDFKKRTRLTICDRADGTDSSSGDVLIFPDMIRYRGLTQSDIDNFVEEVLVQDTVWLAGSHETLKGSYVFVCAHASRDKRCGVCGPALIEKFKEEINSRGLHGQVSVRPCSHIGGHKYAGNVIIFSQNIDGKMTGHWYGYVAPDDVPILLDQHIGEGKIIDHLWRGQMGLSEEEQKKAQSIRLQVNSGINGVENGTLKGEAVGCCQGTGNSTCCQNMPRETKLENNHEDNQDVQRTAQKHSSKSSAGACSLKWIHGWERENTYAALAVVSAAAFVAVAYSCYRQLR